MLSSLRTNIRNRFITGIVIIFPVVVTFLVLKYLFGIMASVLSPLIRNIDLNIPDFAVDMVSVICLSLIIYLIGLFATQLAGRKLISIGEMILARLPIVRSIYNGAKDVAQTLSIRSSDAFKRTVLVEFPRPGIYAVGFVTGKVTGQRQQVFVKVFVPTAPNPTSGFLLILPEKKAIETEISTEEGVKMLVSAGTVSPDGRLTSILGLDETT